MDTGIAPDQLNKFLSSVDVPPVQRNTLDRAKERIAPAVVQTAKDSCEAAIAEERRLTISASRYVYYLHCPHVDTAQRAVVWVLRSCAFFVQGPWNLRMAPFPTNSSVFLVPLCPSLFPCSCSLLPIPISLVIVCVMSLRPNTLPFYPIAYLFVHIFKVRTTGQQKATENKKHFYKTHCSISKQTKKPS